jgi:glycosyltransferase involved in cell wall biosynthesis
MRILLVHNYYQQPGGEDTVFRAERTLLEDAGHEVVVYERHNSEIEAYTRAQRLRLAKRTIRAADSYRDIRELAASHRPHLAHFHNTFPLVSPAGWQACRELGVPTVQTLHNYRLLCPNAVFHRNGRVCEDCLGRAVPWPGIVHGCYRGSRVQSATIAAMLATHRLRGTYRREVSAYIALTEFARTKFIDGGIPEDLISVKPNFVDPDPGYREGTGTYALFVGRVSEEKGLSTLLSAWARLSDIPLRIVGDGPFMEEAVERLKRSGSRVVEFLGRRPRSEVMELLKGARLLVFPSELYEGFPMALVEAFACGVPVIASRLGGSAEIVDDGRTGLLFEPGNAENLAEVVASLWAEPDALARMGRDARALYREKYSAEKNYQKLMNIYEKAMRRRAGESG